MKSKTQVLLVDDNPGITSFLSRGLAKFGIDVVAFNDSKKAIANYKSGYDVCILDVWMPKLSGFELARAIWQQNPAVQICFLSAFELDIDVAQDIFGPVKSRCLLGKPIAASDLAAHITSHFVNASILRKESIKRQFD